MWSKLQIWGKDLKKMKNKKINSFELYNFKKNEIAFVN